MTRPAAFLFSLLMLPVMLAGCVAEFADGTPPMRRDKTLTVAVSIDIPPYVSDTATHGLEIDILEASLPGYKLHYVQVPYGEIETAVQQGKADVAASVRGTGVGETGHIFYSQEFVRFANFAITKASDSRRIDRIADLAGARVLTWQGADLDLGGTFLDMFGAGGPDRAGYVEFADQSDQVRTFWKETGSVAVIDGAIFDYFSARFGYTRADWTKHAVFPLVTGFKVGFKDAKLRDAFNAGLATICRDGRYAAYLQRYGADPSQSVCG